MNKEDIRQLMRDIVFQELTKFPENFRNTDELYDFVSQSYATIKYELQEAIAMGFEDAMTEFSHQDVSYTCNITMIDGGKA
jgi:enolase